MGDTSKTRKPVGIQPPPGRMASVEDNVRIMAVMDRFALEIKQATDWIGDNPYHFHSWLIQQCLTDIHDADAKLKEAMDAGNAELIPVYSDMKLSAMKTVQALNNQRMGYHATMNKPSAHNKGSGATWAQKLKEERDREFASA